MLRQKGAVPGRERTNRAKATLGKIRSVVFWYRLISCRAFVPGLARLFVFTGTVFTAVRAAFWASGSRGALPPVLRRAVCLVRAMVDSLSRMWVEQM